MLYAAGVGAFMIAYGSYVALRSDAWTVRGNRWADAAAGALGGVAGGLAGLPGSFVTIWCSLRAWDKLKQRAVYQPYILAMQLVTLACMRWQAPPRGGVARAPGLVPLALAGAVIGMAIFRRLSNGQFKAAVSILLVVSGLGLLARAL